MKGKTKFPTVSVHFLFSHSDFYGNIFLARKFNFFPIFRYARNVRNFTDSKHVAAHILAKIANFLHKIVLKIVHSNLVVKAAKITQANFFWNEKKV